jgi:hypothetical protein
MSEQQTQAVTTTNTTAVTAPAAGSNYITMILEETKRGFVEANAGLDMDFVRMGDWLKINKKGNFVEAQDENVSYGDKLDVVIGYGEQRWSLWGAENSPEDGQLIVAEKTLEAGQAALADWLEANPEAAERYGMDDVKLRYMAYVVPVQTLSPDDFPKIYLMSFSPTDSIEWGRFAYSVYQGKYKAAGIPARTGVNRIVVRLSTKEKQGKGNQSFIGLEFNAVGLFNPADYGIQVEA